MPRFIKAKQGKNHAVIYTDSTCRRFRSSRTLKIFLLSFLLLMSGIVLAANRLVHYEPEVVTLTGFAKEIVCPGPPNYDNIKKGDIPETYGYLFLKQSIDIDLLPETNELSAGMDQPEKQIKVVQMVLSANPEYWKLVRRGGHVQVAGRLSSWVTGHHHTRVLIDVQKVSEIKTRKQQLKSQREVSLQDCSQLDACTCPS